MSCYRYCCLKECCLFCWNKHLLLDKLSIFNRKINVIIIKHVKIRVPNITRHNSDRIHNLPELLENHTGWDWVRSVGIGNRVVLDLGSIYFSRVGLTLLPNPSSPTWSIRKYRNSYTRRNLGIFMNGFKRSLFKFFLIA